MAGRPREARPRRPESAAESTLRAVSDGLALTREHRLALYESLCRDRAEYERALRAVWAADALDPCYASSQFDEDMALRIAPPQPLLTHLESITRRPRPEIRQLLSQAAATFREAGSLVAGATPAPVACSIRPRPVWLIVGVDHTGDGGAAPGDPSGVAAIVTGSGGLSQSVASAGEVPLPLREGLVDVLYLGGIPLGDAAWCVREARVDTPWVAAVYQVHPGTRHDRFAYTYGCVSQSFGVGDYLLASAEAHGRLLEWVGRVSRGGSPLPPRSLFDVIIDPDGATSDHGSVTANPTQRAAE